LLQQKKQEALQAHIQDIAQKAQMRVNEDWVKKQVAMAGDNPLDRARLSGKPTMVQFSASGCGPCEMMKPIVKKLKKKYEGHHQHRLHSRHGAPDAGKPV
jgi:thiol-disulfide isomerase/thioredoxin